MLRNLGNVTNVYVAKSALQEVKGKWNIPGLNPHLK